MGGRSQGRGCESAHGRKAARIVLRTDRIDRRVFLVSGYPGGGIRARGKHPAFHRGQGRGLRGQQQWPRGAYQNLHEVHGSVRFDRGQAAQITMPKSVSLSFRDSLQSVFLHPALYCALEAIVREGRMN